MWGPYETLTDPSVLDSDRYGTIPAKIVITLIKYWPIFLTAYAAYMLRYSIPRLKEAWEEVRIGHRRKMWDEKWADAFYRRPPKDAEPEGKPSPKSTSNHKPKDEN